MSVNATDMIVPLSKQVSEALNPTWVYDMIYEERRERFSQKETSVSVVSPDQLKERATKACVCA
jgi:hypothetical protein